MTQSRPRKKAAATPTRATKTAAKTSTRAAARKTKTAAAKKPATTGRYSVKSPSRGGRRAGAGRKVESAATRLERSIQARHAADSVVRLAAERLIKEVGLPPRRRLLAGEKVKARTDGPWVAAFCRKLCVQTIGRWSGMPLVLYPEQQAFLDDALAFDDRGDRLYSIAVWEIPRKNGKTTTTSGAGLALTSPAEGEGKPKTVMAAGSAKQAGELYDAATDFIHSHELLGSIFLPARDGIRCPANGGLIERVAGDGKLNHGRNDSLTLADELHAWVTPKQRENWSALTTGDGARDNALLIVISTAGHDLTTILGHLHTQAMQSPYCEMRPEMGGAGFITRDPEARLVMHCYSVAPGTQLDDLDEWKRANPAPWRTKERIRLDLGKRHIDESTKRRLYGNEWTSARDVWIRREEWKTLADPDLDTPPNEAIAAGVDASHRHDTTAAGWAWRLEDGRIAVKAKVFSVRRDAQAHAYFSGDKIKLAAVEAFIAASLLDANLEDAEDELAHGDLSDGDLAGRYQLELVGYDPRFFNRSAELLSDVGVTTVDFEPTGVSMQRAINDFYDDVVQGRIVHDGDPVLAAHVDAASGEKVEAGWRVRRMKATRDIDGLIAVVIAAALARDQLADSVDPWTETW